MELQDSLAVAKEEGGRTTMLSDGRPKEPCRQILQDIQIRHKVGAALMGLLGIVLVATLVAPTHVDRAAASHSGESHFLTDCRCTSPADFCGGELPALSWHIHYTSNVSDMSRFYDAFVEQFDDYFPPPAADDDRADPLRTRMCPFGPNFADDHETPYNYVCSLNDVERVRAHHQTRPMSSSNPWMGLPQLAFFVPCAHKDETWDWAQANRAYVNVFLHPNTGCMVGDHSHRGTWALGEGQTHMPGIEFLDFPCNMPSTGCQDHDFAGHLPCGCHTPVRSEAPSDSCGNCTVDYQI